MLMRCDQQKKRNHSQKIEAESTLAPPPSHTATMTMLVDRLERFADDDEIQWSKETNPNHTEGASSNQRSKFNKKIIWMKKLISPRIFLHQVCSFTLMLVLLFATRSAEAVFTPENRAALKSAVDTCVAETKDGSCPIYAGTNSNGEMDVWDVSKVTDMSLMFSSVTFNADISKWVRHQKCSSLFFHQFCFCF